jgi:pyridoxine 5-phosphate synthase
MIKLGVNIDHVATLRQARKENFPSPLQAASICEKAGADSITTHLREDRRHIQDKDVFDIKNTLRTKLNFEMAACEEIINIALELQPYSVCIVPEKRQEVTTEGGLDVYSQQDRMKNFVKPLTDAGILVSLFIDPDEKQVEAAFKTGAQYIELHTGAYSLAFGTATEETEFLKLKNAASLAQNLGLKVNAGHGLNYQNVYRMHEIPCIEELNIGHSIISRAIFVGLETAVKEMMNLVNKN